MTYIKRFSIIAIAALAFQACSDDVLDGSASQYLEGDAKSPVMVSALLDADVAAPTRAVDKQFETGDELLAYFRHVTWSGKKPSDADYDASADGPALVTTDKSPLLVTFTKGSADMTDYTTEIYPLGLGGTIGLGITASPANTKQTDDLTASTTLYWDDFSTGAKGDATDIRTAGHYLESYYGYCYNGGTPTTALVPETGVLGWTVSAAQDVVPASATEPSNFQKSDLLWSCEQTPVAYAHVDADGNKNHGTFILPYTHAMSKVTIEVVLDEGYDLNADGTAQAFGTSSTSRIATTPTLYANRVTTLTAPNYTQSTTVASGEADAKIAMRLADDEKTTKKHRVYEAIIAPTVMKAGNRLASITVDGNNYDINLTHAMLTTVPDGATAAWSSELKQYAQADGKITKTSPAADYTEANGGITLPGVNYRIKVTLKKQKIEVKAYITDWKDVEASIEGTIMFDADVKESNVGSLTEISTGSFDLWRSLNNADNDSYDANDDDEDGINKASTYSRDAATQLWVGAPELYWKNASTSYYFRALATVPNPATAPTVIQSVGGSRAAEQGTDLVWAQTSRHTARDANGNDIKDNRVTKTYDAGAAINPRTSEVPLTFEHAMSKITVKLEDGNKDAELPAGVEATDYDNPLNPRINLEGATISIINLYDGGTINLTDGSISELTSPADKAPAGSPFTIKDQSAPLSEYVVIPQSLVKDRDGGARNSTPSFYNSTDLTEVGGLLYVTDSLVYVPAVRYADTPEDLDLIKAHNATLPGHVTTLDIRVPAVEQVNYTYETFSKANAHKSFTPEQFALLEGEHKAAKLKSPEEAAVYYTFDEFKALTVLTETQFDALPARLKVKDPTNVYTEETAADENANHLIADSEGRVPTDDGYVLTYQDGYTPVNEGEIITTPDNLYTYQEYLEYQEASNSLQVNAGISQPEFDALSENVRLKTSAKEAEYYTYEEFIALDYLTEAQFIALPPELRIQVPHEDAIYYTLAEANAYNALLPGAVGVGSVKVPAYYKLPDGEVTPHNPGELKEAGDKIMIYVTLADGTLYSAELSECKVISSQSSHHAQDETIKQWYPGVSYIYTITLTKEKITFRALIEKWQEVKGGGTATLDWD